MGQLEAQILSELERLGNSLASDHRSIMQALLERKVRQAGRRLTASTRAQIEEIADAVASGDDDAVEAIARATAESRGGNSRDGKALSINFEKSDWDWALSAIQGELTKACAAMLRESVVDKWKELQACRDLIAADDVDAHWEVTRTIQLTWGRSLRWCQLLIALCAHIAKLVADEASGRGAKPKVRQATKVALQHLHARGCLAFREILHLLTGGFPDAAIARWRLLHELDVFSVVIAGGPPQLASRFMAHERMELHGIVAANAAGSGNTPEVEAIDKRRQRELKRYGPHFAAPLGWAIELVGKKRPQFRDLEMLAEKSQHRQAYLVACSAVHASSVGVRRPLGGGGPGQMLVGPSSAEVFYPAVSAVKSLVLLSSTLLSVTESIDCAAAFGLLDRAGKKTLRELEVCERRGVEAHLRRGS